MSYSSANAEGEGAGTVSPEHPGRAKRGTFVRTVAGIIILKLGFVLAFIVFYFRADSPDELHFICTWDIWIGLFFGAGYLLLRDVSRSSGGRNQLFSLVGALLIWLLVSGALLAWHKTVARVRWYVPPRTFALNDVAHAAVALRDFARDCGDLPTQEQGLEALCSNPGIEGWSGPYLNSADLIDPWGERLHYQFDEGRAVVWSLGSDRRNGTADDLRREVEPSGGQPPKSGE